MATKSRDASDALNEILRANPTWMKIMVKENESELTGFWIDWFNEQNFKKVMVAFNFSFEDLPTVGKNLLAHRIPRTRQKIDNANLIVARYYRYLHFMKYKSFYWCSLPNFKLFPLLSPRYDLDDKPFINYYDRDLNYHQCNYCDIYGKKSCPYNDRRQRYCSCARYDECCHSYYIADDPDDAHWTQFDPQKWFELKNPMRMNHFDTPAGSYPSPASSISL